MPIASLLADAAFDPDQAEADERDILRNGQVGQYSAVDDAALF